MNKKQIRKAMMTSLDKHLTQRKALANRQYKKRRELKELKELIEKYEQELKEQGGIPSKRFIYNQNRRIERSTKLMLQIRKNTEKLIDLDARIAMERRELKWTEIIRNPSLRKHLESFLADVEELRTSSGLQSVVMDKDLRHQIESLYFLARKLKSQK